MSYRKRIERRICCALATLTLFSSVSLSQWNVTLFVQPLPSPYLSDWESNPTVGSLIITNNTDTPSEVIIYLTLSRSGSGVIATGNSPVISIPAGTSTQVNSDRFIDWNSLTYDPSMKNQVIQAGRLPEGEYDACITLRTSAGAVLASDVCTSFSIVYPEPPSLVFPVNADTLDSPYPVFTWTPVQVPAVYQLHYILKMVEVLPGQIPHQALLANVAQFEDNNLLSTGFQYPISALPLEPGKTYAWQVEAVDQNGFPPSGNEGRSEIWTFVVRGTSEVVPPATGSASIALQLVPQGTAVGSLADFSSSSFDTVAQHLATLKTSGGNAQIPFPSPASFPPITLTLAGRDIYIDFQKKSIAIKGGWTKDSVSYETLFTAGWGTGRDPRDICWTIKGPMLSRVMPGLFSGLTEEYILISFADYTLKASDLPDSVTGFFGHEVIAGKNVASEVELKPGVNFLGKFDLHRFSGTIMKALGVEKPFALLKGHISPSFDFVLSSGDSAKWEAAWEGFIGASLPLTRSIVSWMPKADLELKFGYEAKRTDSLSRRTVERKINATFTISANLTFPFLRTVSQLNDTIGVKGSIAYERSLGRNGEGEWIAALQADDIVQFPKFENVFKLHDPTLEWNISKKSVKWRGEFDFGKYKRVGTLEVEIAKKDTSSQPDTTGLQPSTNPTTGSPGSGPDTTGLQPSTNPTTGLPGSQPVPSNTPPALPSKVNLAAMMNKEQPEPLTGGKPSKKFEWKVTAKFRPAAVLALSPANIIQTALQLKENLFGQNSDFSPAIRNSAPAPSYAAPEIPDFLSNLPAFEELSMSFLPGSLGSMVIRGKTAYNNSSTEIIAARAQSATRKGFILGLRPQNWSIKNYFPDFSMPGLANATLSNVALVFSNIEGVMPSSELTDEEHEFYSAAYGSDDFTLVIKPGLNLIATIPSEKLIGNGPIALFVRKLGVQQGDILLQGNLGRKIKDIYLLGAFPSMHPEGSPKWFDSGQMGIEITGQPSVGLVGALALNIKGETRVFFVKTSAGKQGLVLSGGMIAQGGWESPFGIHGLTLNKVVVLIGITSMGSVQLGFEGDLEVGTKDMHTAVLVAVNAVTGVPTNFMFDGESKAGFGVSDLVDLHNKMEAGSPPLLVDKIPPLFIEDPKLKFAPKDSPDLGITRGLTVKGLLELKPASGPSGKKLAYALFDISTDGLIARADISSFALGPVKLQKASMDLTLTREDQHFTLDGKASLGFMSGEIDMSLTKTEAMFHADTKIFNAFEADLDAKGVLDLKKPAFEVHAKLKNDFSNVFSKNMRLAINNLVESKTREAAIAADAADKNLQAAIKAREAAQKKWVSTPLFPRKSKVAARNAWEKAVARVTALRVEKQLKESKKRRWTLAQKFLAAAERRQRKNMIVVRRAEFDADLTKLRTGAVQKMELALSIGEKQFDLNLADWNFKNIGKSVKTAARNVADKLFESFQ